MKKPKSVAGHKDALAVYLELGPGRSLAKVRAALDERYGKGPALGTLGAWSSEHKWVRQAKEYDARVAAAAIEKAESQAIDVRTAQIGAYEAALRMGTKVLEQAEKLFEEATDENGGPFQVKSIADLNAIVDAIDKASKRLEVLSGGVSDRTEQISRDGGEWSDLTAKYRDAAKQASGGTSRAVH